jgi:pyruvate, orthophosphate dikinase
MPGMMDTVLNLGLNDAVVEALAAKMGARPAWDSYRRFLDLFASVVLGVEHSEFEALLIALKVRTCEAPAEYTCGYAQRPRARHQDFAH